MTRHFDFEILRSATRALDDLQTRQLSANDPEFLACAPPLATFFAITLRQPQWFKILVDSFERRYPKDKFDDVMGWFLERAEDIDRYEIGSFLATRAIQERNWASAYKYQEHVLVQERALDSATEKASIEDHISYDTERHADGARQLCYYALMDNPSSLRNAQLRVLDIGCGTGLNTEYLIRYTAHLTGLDVSLTSLRRSGRAKRYDCLIEGDARETLARVESEMDLIILTGAVYFFPDLNWLFANSARLLSVDGQLVFNAIPTPDGSDYLITRAGNYRYCHSLDYLKRTSKQYGFFLEDPTWTVCYSLPYWLLRFKRLRN